MLYISTIANVVTIKGMLHATDLIPSKTAMDDNIGNNMRYFFHWGTYTAKDSMNILPEGNTHVKLSRFFIFSTFYSSTIYFLINFMWNCFMHKSVIRLIIYFCGSCVIFYAKKKKKNNNHKWKNQNYFLCEFFVRVAHF